MKYERTLKEQIHLSLALGVAFVAIGSLTAVWSIGALAPAAQDAARARAWIAWFVGAGIGVAGGLAGVRMYKRGDAAAIYKSESRRSSAYAALLVPLIVGPIVLARPWMDDARVEAVTPAVAAFGGGFFLLPVVWAVAGLCYGWGNECSPQGDS